MTRPTITPVHALIGQLVREYGFQHPLSEEQKLIIRKEVINRQSEERRQCLEEYLRLKSILGL